MINNVSVKEMERVCEFLELDFRTYKDNNGKVVSCEIQYPFEDCPTDEFVVIDNQAIKNKQIAQKIKELRGHRARIKELQNEIKLLTKGQ